MTKCFDEATLQSFVDGEVSMEAAREINLHLAACERCRALVGEIESEMQFFAATFEMKTPVAVPSDALRARIEARISETTRAFVVESETANLLTPNQTPAKKLNRFANWRESLSAFFAGFGFTQQLVAACLAFAFVGAISFAAWQLSQQNSTSQSSANLQTIADNTAPTEKTPIVSKTSAPQVGIPKPNDSKKNQTATNMNSPVQQSSQRSDAHLAQTRREHSGELRTVPANYPKPEPREVENNLIPGEQNYLKTIATLRAAIKERGEETLSPQARIEYERNLAVVDRAILETRTAAKANPKDASVRDFMYAAYQSKVELLSSVAEQAQTAPIAVR